MATYNIQPNSVTPGGEEQNMPYQVIMPILHGLKPGDVASAGAAFENLGKVLDGVAERLKSTAMKLAADNSWRGTAAEAAMMRFQQLHNQAAQLAANAHTTANSVNWIGHDVLPKYQSIPNPQVMGTSESDAIMGGAAMGPAGAAGGAALGAMGIGPNGQAKADKAAREYMSTLNGHLASAPFPQTIQGPGTDPHMGAGQWITPGSGGGSGSGGGGSATGYRGVGGSGGSGAGAPMPGYTPPAGAGQFNPAKLPSGGAGPGASLQSYTPPAGAGTGSPFGSGAPGTLTTGGGSANPFSRMPMMPGEGGLGRGGLPGEEGIPGEGGLGEGLGKGGLPGESGLADGAAGEAGSAAADGVAGEAAAGEAAAGEAAGAEGMGMNGMPMAGSGSGQQDKERQRQAWMHEDEDIWGVPKDDVGPVIG